MKKKGMKRLFVMAIVVISLFFVSCSDSKQRDIDRLNEKVDSLLKENEKKDGDINDMMSFVGILADGLDSIAKQENMLFYSNKGVEGTMVDRQQLKKNLEMFENTLAIQKKRIEQLVDSLRARGESLSKLTNLVNYLNQQLDEKNAVIKQLRNDLDNKNVDIAHLQHRVSSLTESNMQLTEKVEKQVKALTTQAEMINEGYVKIASKKTLTDLGIISGGLLKKTKVNFDAIQKSSFMRVDIRTFTEIPIKSSHPKVLTQMPSSSYRIDSSGNMSTLHIIDPVAFWSISNYLIIQL